MATTPPIVVELRADIRDLKKGLSKAQKEIKNLDKSTKSSKKNTSALSSAFGKLSGVAGTLGIGLGAVAAVGVGKKLFEIGLQSEKLRVSFDNLTKSVGVLSDTLLKDLRVATLGTVSDLELIRNANQAMLLGIDPKALPIMFNAALSASQATGRPITLAIQDITTGIGRQSKLILDNLGIIVNVEKANKKYAKSLGKVASELSDVERKQAFVNETLEVAAFNALKVGINTDAMAIQVDKGKAAFANLGEFIATDFLQSTGETVQMFRDMGEAIGILNPEIGASETAVNQLADAYLGLASPMMELTSGLTVSEDAFKKVNLEAQGILDTLNDYPGVIDDLTQNQLLKLRDGFVDSSLTIQAADDEISELRDRYVELGGAISDLLDPNERSISQSERRISQFDDERDRLIGVVRAKQRVGQSTVEELKQLDELKVKKAEELASIKEKRKELTEIPKKIEELKKKQEAAQPAVDKFRDTAGETAVNLRNAKNQLDEIPSSIDRVIDALAMLQNKKITFTIFQRIITQRSRGGLAITTGRQEGGIIGAQGGRLVPGTGTGDKIPALLEPGEFVLNRNATEAVGLNRLNNLNFKTAPRFAGGGMATGGGGVVVNIGTVVGLDADDIADILGRRLGDILSTL